MDQSILKNDTEREPLADFGEPTVLSIADNAINVAIHKVAHRAWSNELVQKYQKPYTAKWAIEQGVISQS